MTTKTNPRNRRTALINSLQKRHPKTRRQRTYHGVGRYSVQFFSIETGLLVAEYDLTRILDYETVAALQLGGE